MHLYFGKYHIRYEFMYYDKYHIQYDFMYLYIKSYSLRLSHHADPISGRNRSLAGGESLSFIPPNLF